MLKLRSRLRDTHGRSPRAVAIAAVLAIAVLLVGCSTAEVRTDSDPLTSRFPQLEGLVSAEWASGTLGDDSVPGPALYWIDAVIALSPEHLDRIIDGIELGPADQPDINESLSAALPAGPFTGAAELDAAFSEAPYQTTITVDRDAGIIVLSTIFE